MTEDPKTLLAFFRGTNFLSPFVGMFRGLPADFPTPVCGEELLL